MGLLHDVYVEAALRRSAYAEFRLRNAEKEERADYRTFVVDLTQRRRIENILREDMGSLYYTDCSADDILQIAKAYRNEYLSRQETSAAEESSPTATDGIVNDIIVGLTDNDASQLSEHIRHLFAFTRHQIAPEIYIECVRSQARKAYQKVLKEFGVTKPLEQLSEKRIRIFGRKHADEISEAADNLFRTLPAAQRRQLAAETTFQVMVGYLQQERGILEEDQPEQ